MTIEERLAELENKFAAMSVAQRAAGDPSGYYTSIYSGEQIDAAIGNVLNVGNNPIAIKNIGAAPRRNLLDNWYFAGGGSQQGGGQFPVNQRGQSVYDTGTASGYGIDRWWSIFCNYNITTGVLSHSTSQTYGGSMRQAIESHGRLAGRTVVLSVLADRMTGTPSSISIFKSSGMNSGMSFIGSTTISNGLNTLVVNLPNDVGGDTYPILVVSINVAIGSSFRVIAVKLELGPTQTLAYQDEDGNWQLFETPDYAEELAKCQRYFYRINVDIYSRVGYGVQLGASNRFVMSIPLAQIMRVAPVVQISGTFQVEAESGSVALDSVTTFSAPIGIESSLLCNVSTNVSGALRLRAMAAGAYIDFIAEE